MNRKCNAYGAKEHTGKRRHHLPKTAKLPIAGEQGAGVTKAAWSLRRIRGDLGDRADRPLRHITQCGEPAGNRSHMRRLASRHRNIRDRYLLPRPRSLARLPRHAASGAIIVSRIGSTLQPQPGDPAAPIKVSGPRPISGRKYSAHEFVSP